MIVRNSTVRLLVEGRIASKRFMSTVSRNSILQSQRIRMNAPLQQTCLQTSSLTKGNLPILVINRTYASSTLKFKQASISEDEYHVIADSCFDALTESLEELVEEYDGPDVDEYELEFASGVLTLRLGSHGTYVINKQPPNKQIWFSSPTSGPKRFDYDATHKEWFMHKDGEEWNFRNLFNRELSEVFDKPIEINFGN